MKLIIDKVIREKYPDLRIGIVVAKNVDNKQYRAGLEENVAKTFSDFALKYESVKDFEEEKNISVWREVYRSFGVNPKKKKPTAESFLSRTIKSGYVPHISPAVDMYLCAETVACLPIGGYDLEKISENIILTLAHGGEEFFGVGAESLETTAKDEVIYKDNIHVLTRCWNYRDSNYTKIDAETKTLALFSEAPLSDINDEEILATAKKIADNLKVFCDADCSILMLGKEQDEIIIV